eukprot:584502-Rhodomonas_salina.1
MLPFQRVCLCALEPREAEREEEGEGAGQLQDVRVTARGTGYAVGDTAIRFAVLPSTMCRIGCAVGDYPGGYAVGD